MAVDREPLLPSRQQPQEAPRPRGSPLLRRQTSDPKSAWRRRAGRVVSSCVAGVVSFLLATIMAVTFGMLVFEPVPGGVASGVQMALVGVSIVGNTVLVFTAQLPCVVVTADNGVVAPVVAQVVVQLTRHIEDPDDLRATAVAAVALGCTCFGLLQLLFTQLRLTAFVQYLPYSIPMGFLSGIGLELCSAVALAGGYPSQAAAAAFAAVLCLGSWWRGWSLSVLFPVLLSTSITAFYALGGPSSWLLELESDSDITETAWLWSDVTLGAVHWNHLLWVGPPWLLVLCLLGSFQNCLFAELYTRMPGLVDPVTPDQVLFEFSQSFALGGILGFAGGFHNMACISLSRELKSYSRAPASIVAFLSCGLWLAGLGPMLKVPRFIFAGLLLWVGLKFLRQYLWRPCQMLPRGEAAVIVFVALTMKVGGFPLGVIGGLVLALAHMVVDQASLSCVQRVSDGCEARSNVIRSVKAEQLLLTHGQSVLVARLAPGFVFFATSAQLLRIVEQRLGKTSEKWQVQDTFRNPGTLLYDSSDSEREDEPRTAAQATALHDVVIDFTLCRGFDGSLVGVLQQMDALAEREKFRIRIAGLEATQCRRIRAHTSIKSEFFFTDMDHAMESVEEDLLKLLLGERRDKERSRPGLKHAGTSRQLHSDDTAAEVLGLDRARGARREDPPGYALLFLYSDASAASRAVRPAVAQASALLERQCEFFEASTERCPQLSQEFEGELGAGPRLVLLYASRPCSSWQVPMTARSTGEGVAVLPGAADIAREVERRIQEREASDIGGLNARLRRTSSVKDKDGVSVDAVFGLQQGSVRKASEITFSEAQAHDCPAQGHPGGVSAGHSPSKPGLSYRQVTEEMTTKELWRTYLQRAGVSEGPLERLAEHLQEPRRLAEKEVLFHKGAALESAYFVFSGHLSLWNEGRGHDQESWVPDGAMFADTPAASVKQEQPAALQRTSSDKELHPALGTSRLLAVGAGWALGGLPAGARSGLRPQLAPLTCVTETEACVLAISAETARQLGQEDPALALALRELLDHFHALVLQHAAAALSDWHALVFSKPDLRLGRSMHQYA